MYIWDIYTWSGLYWDRSQSGPRRWAGRSTFRRADLRGAFWSIELMDEVGSWGELQWPASSASLVDGGSLACSWSSSRALGRPESSFVWDCGESASTGRVLGCCGCLFAAPVWLVVCSTHGCMPELGMVVSMDPLLSSGFSSTPSSSRLGIFLKRLTCLVT